MVLRSSRLCHLDPQAGSWEEAGGGGVEVEEVGGESGGGGGGGVLRRSLDRRLARPWIVLFKQVWLPGQARPGQARPGQPTRTVVHTSTCIH